MSSSNSNSTDRQPGRILTFYSYKGGTGRSMALANVAWILAANGKRVLVIDWDLEAPGLHRYFRPFLADPELHETPGLINFFMDFVEASRMERRSSSNNGSQPAPDWFENYTNLLRYAVALDYEFPGEGTLDFVSAGRQGPDYALNVISFEWRDFYEQLGGGVFLEAVKSRLREEYDYILIDSRTGLSDTSGICTVQMPDDLVVCFTLNRQSILGARDVSRSAEQQRRKPSGSPGLRVWPVPMRVELAEKDRLDNARTLMRNEFVGTTWHFNRTVRADYWSQIEIVYVPYYAYEEVLATIADKPGTSTTLLHAMLNLTRHLTNGEITKLASIPEKLRLDLLAKSLGAAASRSSSSTNGAKIKVVVIYSRDDIANSVIRDLATRIETLAPNLSVFWDGCIAPGTRWDEQLREGIASAQIAVIFYGPHAGTAKTAESKMLTEIRKLAANSTKAVLPIAIKPVKLSALPDYLVSWAGIEFDSQFTDSEIESVADAVVGVSNQFAQASEAPADADDPQKGRWGGSPMRNRRVLSAHVTNDGDWFQVTLTVTGLPGSSELGDVSFHLHPTFDSDVETVPAVDGKAELTLHAWGAFTVGAVTDGGSTTLELDLSTLPDAPQAFRER